MIRSLGARKTTLSLILALMTSFLRADLGKAKSSLKKEDFPNAIASFYKEFRDAKDEKSKIIAEYGLAQSLVGLDLNYSAAKIFSNIIRRGSDNNPYFIKSFESFYKIHKAIDFSPEYLDSVLQNSKIDYTLLGENEKNFYLFTKGRLLFENLKFQSAYDYFALVSTRDKDSAKAVFYRGIIEASMDRSSEAIKSFKKAINLSKKLALSEAVREEAYLNIARVYYGDQKYKDAIKFYSKISPTSHNWLEALFEAAWAFYLMEKPNNTLGNLHTISSPFFSNRFFPEADILRSVAFFQLCYFEGVEKLLADFEKKYKPLRSRLEKIISNSEKKKSYLSEYLVSRKVLEDDPLEEVFKDLLKVESYKRIEASKKNITSEEEEISSLFDIKLLLEFKKELLTSLKEEKRKQTDESEAELLDLLKDKKAYLDNMFEQTILIKAQTLLKNIDHLKRKLNIKTDSDKELFIGGMQKLVLGQALEYWPFDGEYWKDELGGYVYNIPNLCQK